MARDKMEIHSAMQMFNENDKQQDREFQKNLDKIQKDVDKIKNQNFLEIYQKHDMLFNGLHQLSSELAKTNKDNKSKIEKLQKEASEKEAQISSMLEDIAVANGKVVELSQKYEDVSKQDSAKVRKEIARLSQEIKKKYKQIETIVSDASILAEGKKYEDYAKDNKSSAGWLFWISIVAMVGVATFMTYHFWNITSENIKYFWARASLSFIILLPAFFMMRESKKLKDKEFQYYDIACRIKTSAPYIDGLSISDEEKGTLKANLVKEFFGRPIECKDDGGLPPIDQICEVIKTCLDKKS